MWRGRGGRSGGKFMGRSREKEPLSPDNSEHIGYANLDNAGTKVFLVKLPQSLYDVFANKPAEDGGGEGNVHGEGVPGPVVGRVRIPKSNTNNSNSGGKKREGPMPKIFLDAPPNTSTPTVYDLRMQATAANIQVFSESSDTAKPYVQCEGVVSHQCTAQPSMSRNYRALTRERTVKSVTKLRTTLVMDDDTRREADNLALKPTAGFESRTMKEDKKRAKEKARKHLDINDADWRKLAKTAVFRAFETRINYSADMLAAEVDEPVNRLRTILNDVCTYHKAGAFSGTYLLKAEFMSQAQRQEKENAEAEHKQAQADKIRARREERIEDERANKRSRMN